MKRRLKIIDQIIRELKAARTIAIAGHMRPDGDCIGSELALTYALKNLGKKVTAFNQDEMPEKLTFLDPEKVLTGPRPPRPFDAVVVTDCANFERMGPFAIQSANAARSSTSIITAPTHATATSTGSTPNQPAAANSSTAFSSRPSGRSPRPSPIASLPLSAPIPVVSNTPPRSPPPTTPPPSW